MCVHPGAGADTRADTLLKSVSAHVGGGHTFLKCVRPWVVLPLVGHTFGRATRAGGAGLCGAELKGAGGILTELGADGWRWAVVE